MLKGRSKTPGNEKHPWDNEKGKREIQKAEYRGGAPKTKNPKGVQTQ